MTHTATATRDLSRKYCPRFGQIAVEMGFITPPQLTAALDAQVEDEREARRHRLLGTILFERDWMSGDQIDLVMNRLLKSMRVENG